MSEFYLSHDLSFLMNLTLASCVYPLARCDLPPRADFTYGTEEVLMHRYTYGWGAMKKFYLSWIVSNDCLINTHGNSSWLVWQQQLARGNSNGTRTVIMEINRQHLGCNQYTTVYLFTWLRASHQNNIWFCACHEKCFSLRSNDCPKQ